MRALEMAAVHAGIMLDAADDRLDGRAALQLALDGLGDAAFLALDEDAEAVRQRRVAAAIAAINDGAADLRSRGLFDGGNDGGERVPVPWVKPEGRLRGCPAASSHGWRTGRRPSG